MGFTIAPVSRDNVEDYLRFFDNMKFPNHPDWEICYCYSFHFVGSEEEWNDRENNRASVKRLISEGKMKGYLAYEGKNPIGWCNANDKLNYERLKLDNSLWDNTTYKICSVVCFVINPEYRNQKVATRLLTQVCDDYRKKDYRFVEAYPRKGDRPYDDHFPGPPSMYEKLGFQIIRETGGFCIVRKDLSGNTVLSSEFNNE